MRASSPHRRGPRLGGPGSGSQAQPARPRATLARTHACMVQSPQLPDPSLARLRPEPLAYSEALQTSRPHLAEPRERLRCRHEAALEMKSSHLATSRHTLPQVQGGLLRDGAPRGGGGGGSRASASGRSAHERPRCCGLMRSGLRGIHLRLLGELPPLHRENGRRRHSLHRLAGGGVAARGSRGGRERQHGGGGGREQ